MSNTTLTRAKMTQAIKKKTGLPINQASVLFDRLLNLIEDTLKQGHPVALRRFGTLRCHQKKQRIGRNPKTMEEAIIPARNVVRFKIAPTLKKRINDSINA
jgi:integration host factor subunit alpha